MPRLSARAVVTLMTMRCLVEGIALAVSIGLVHAALGAVAPLPLTVGTVGATGVALVLVATLRERATEQRGRVIVAVALAAAVALALLLPTRGLGVAGWVARVVLFAVLAEVFLWRLLSLARGAVRWTDARNAVPYAVIAIAVASVAPGPIDRVPLAPLALLVVAATTVSLALARSTEELSLSRQGEQRASTRVSSANAVAFVIGVAAVIAAVAAPAVEQLLVDLAKRLAPVLSTILFVVLLPLGYLAALLIELLAPLLRSLRLPQLLTPVPPRTPEEEAEILRDLERNRQFVVGGFEVLFIAAIAVFALVLLERLVRERRLALPRGVELERSPTEGIGLGATLRSLLPVRTRRRRAPRDDGSRAAAIRLAYWQLLALSERYGPGWRSSSETPDEHGRRLVESDPRWARAAPVVNAFDRLRYGELLPDAAAVAEARLALRELETATRT